MPVLRGGPEDVLLLEIRDHVADKVGLVHRPELRQRHALGCLVQRLEDRHVVLRQGRLAEEDLGLLLRCNLYTCKQL